MESGTLGFRIKSKIANGVLYLKDNQVYSIRYADVNLYQDGEFKDTILNHILTNDEEVFIKSQAEINVKKFLKSPSTAKFASYSKWEFSKKDGYIFAKAYVDSQNSFGAMVRSDFEMKVKIDTNTIVSLKLDGEECL